MIYNFISSFSLKKTKPEWTELLDYDIEEQPEINIIKKSVDIELKEIKIEKIIEIENIIEIEKSIKQNEEVCSKNSFYNFVEKIFSKDDKNENENILNFLDLF